MRKHINRHIINHGHKIHYHFCHTKHVFLHFGELALVGVLGFMSLIFASSSNLPNNTSFSYPLKQVSTLECRTLYRNEMPESCKISLPRIYGGNYSTYKDNELYRSIYTVLWAAPYSDSWNQKVGAHGGLDIATARGTPLYSIGDGEVYSAGRNSAYGNLVRIKYVYNGEIVYAVYAHMDTINVKAGDKVSKGQRVGTVGNSGNTFGELGGYHVHFEIAKDNFGRPAYAYTNCPDLNKGHYRIIQDGLCRTELITYQYDPIRIFEAGSQYIPPIQEKEPDLGTGVDGGSGNNTTPDQNDSSIDNKNETTTPNSDTDEEDLQSEDGQIEEGKKEEDKHPSGDQNNSEIITGDQKPILDDKEKEDKLPITPIETAPDKEDDPFLIELKFDSLKHLAEHFVRLWDVEMRSELKEKSLLVGETLSLDIEVFKKGKKDDKNNNFYNGVLQVPFVFLSNNDNVTLDTNSYQLITKGKGKINITGNKVGKSSIVIKIGDYKIGILDVIVK